MVIADFELRRWAENGGLDPYDPECINPASVDLRWSGKFRVADYDGWSKVYPSRDRDILHIEPHQLYLLDTLEYITVPDNWCGVIALKSGIGRTGLEHLHAGFFDPGFAGTATLEITNMAPWTAELRPFQPIIQIVFYVMKNTPKKVYADVGHYQGQREPTPARLNV